MTSPPSPPHRMVIPDGATEAAASGIPNDCDEQELRQAFGRFGPVREVVFAKQGPETKDAVIRFDGAVGPTAADDGKAPVRLRSKALRVDWSKPGPADPTAAAAGSPRSLRPSCDARTSGGSRAYVSCGVTPMKEAEKSERSSPPVKGVGHANRHGTRNGIPVGVTVPQPARSRGKHRRRRVRHIKITAETVFELEKELDKMKQLQAQVTYLRDEKSLIQMELEEYRNQDVDQNLAIIVALKEQVDQLRKQALDHEESEMIRETLKELRPAIQVLASRKRSTASAREAAILVKEKYLEIQTQFKGEAQEALESMRQTVLEGAAQHLIQTVEHYGKALDAGSLSELQDRLEVFFAQAEARCPTLCECSPCPVDLSIYGSEPSFEAVACPKLESLKLASKTDEQMNLFFRHVEDTLALLRGQGTDPDFQPGLGEASAALTMALKREVETRRKCRGARADALRLRRVYEQLLWCKQYVEELLNEYQGLLNIADDVRKDLQAQTNSVANDPTLKEGESDVHPSKTLCHQDLVPAMENTLKSETVHTSIPSSKKYGALGPIGMCEHTLSD